MIKQTYSKCKEPAKYVLKEEAKTTYFCSKHAKEELKTSEVMFIPKI
jgi:YHS domain-containing protein